MARALNFNIWFCDPSTLALLAYRIRLPSHSLCRTPSGTKTNALIWRRKRKQHCSKTFLFDRILFVATTALEFREFISNFANLPPGPYSFASHWHFHYNHYFDSKSTSSPPCDSFSPLRRFRHQESTDEPVTSLLLPPPTNVDQ